ncbi:DNA-processing protein DprA [Undibacterium terreum]|uniref:DNA processing protein DprA n=1 Tax=Undibacterium terreum TaxID=1224302 RepID=A0A916UZY7_9BURK|nr:DNA-processing protein DprA [Undibacterium terreum]GGC96585.1 DNA processing protein DprA [Undibacterium terreum]
MSDTELADWIRLEQTPGVGQETARKLLAAFGLPQQILAAGFPALRSIVPDRIALPLSQPPSEQILSQIARTLEWCDQPGNAALTLADAGYPPSLLNIPDPPVILYVKGRLDLLQAPSIAVVGSRNATAQGIDNAEKFSESLSRAGWTIVSGMAAGIDAAAHQGGLRGPGSTVAVIGTGADIVYPARNRALAHLIADGGCIVSEYPLGMPAIAANFPRRNRIISGLAKGVLVVEAAAQSGSLITARMAAEQGRDVFAIPGSIHSPLAKGCHLLIKQGAKLVESAQDILDELMMGPAQPSLQASLAEAGADHPLLSAMGYDPVHIDTLALRTGHDVAELHGQLLTLELDGSIEQLPGANYRRVA